MFVFYNYYNFNWVFKQNNDCLTNFYVNSIFIIYNESLIHSNILIKISYNFIIFVFGKFSVNFLN